MSTKRPMPHLFITENMIDAIKSVPQDSWKEFFESIEKTRFETIKSCPDKDLTTERGKLTMISELQGIFFAIHNHKETKPE